MSVINDTDGDLEKALTPKPFDYAQDRPPLSRERGLSQRDPCGTRSERGECGPPGLHPPPGGRYLITE